MDIRYKTLIVKTVNDNIQKYFYTRDILNSLSEWFGNPVALEEYVAQVADYPFIGGFDENGDCLGFFSLKIHYETTGEIFVCGIKKGFHGMGIGQSIYREAENFFKVNGCSRIIVKTLSDKVNYEPYEKTRKFYEKIGFIPLITLTEMWDEHNPCLIMLKTL